MSMAATTTRSAWWVVMAAFVVCCAVGIWPYSAAAALDDEQTLMIRSVVADVGSADVTSSTPTKIVGRGGLCVDIKDGIYNDGTPIQLWPCLNNSRLNQLWSLEADGTIRSNGSCLTTYAYRPGSYIMIYKCAVAVRLGTIWQVWADNGTIINPESGLVLTAKSGANGAILTVETNTYALSQGWTATNVTAPAVASIVGFGGLCLRANGSEVWVEECNAAAGSADQKWALYGDGSIRPDANRTSCLTASQLLAKSVINVSSCGPASAAQRWLFTTGGTILNPNTGMVMDVKASNPTLREIIVFPPTGNPNQQWNFNKQLLPM